jgi:ferredoxin-NADP reductase
MASSLGWQVGTVTEIRQETARAKTFSFRLPNWTAHKAGMHYDLRLTAPDGYQAERSYSVASEPERQGVVELTIELIEDGEVSPYMHEVVQKGDRLELRGPIGGYFVWDVAFDGPVLLVGGGSGVVPLRAMVRHRVAAGSKIPFGLLYSARSAGDVIYASELTKTDARADGFRLVLTYTRQAPTGWTGYKRRVDREMLKEVLGSLGTGPRAYVCGPTLLVESVANNLLDLGVPTDRVRVERFGPTGT